MTQPYIITAHAPLKSDPQDWQASLGLFFQDGTIDGPNNAWRIQTEDMTLKVIVYDNTIDPKEVDRCASYDIEANAESILWAKDHERHAIIVAQGNDPFETKLLAAQAAQIIGAQAILWSDNAFIRPEVIKGLADGILPEAFALFSIAAWEDADDTYGFMVIGLEAILDGWIVMPAVTEETHAYSRTLRRITTSAALLAEQGLAGNTVIPDSSEEGQTLGVVREENLIHIFPQQPKENTE